jgi:hypothetical protein
MKLQKFAVGTAIAGLVFAFSGGSALADSGNVASALGPAPDAPASGWQIGYYTPSLPGTLSFAEAFEGSGEASLNFTDEDNTALLVTRQKAQYPTLLGDLRSATSISTTFTVTGVTGIFTYYGEPSCGPTPQEGGIEANVRFYFQTSNSGGFDETHYWWSNPISWPLLDQTSNGSATIYNSFGSGSGAFWSDYYGHFGDDPLYAAGFQTALSNVTQIGLSFGGGCFFENGVGTSDGSGTFTMDSYSVS